MRGATRRRIRTRAVRRGPATPRSSSPPAPRGIGAGDGASDGRGRRGALKNAVGAGGVADHRSPSASPSLGSPWGPSEQSRRPGVVRGEREQRCVRGPDRRRFRLTGAQSGARRGKKGALKGWGRDVWSGRLGAQRPRRTRAARATTTTHAFRWIHPPLTCVSAVQTPQSCETVNRSPVSHPTGRPPAGPHPLLLVANTLPPR